MNNKIIKSGDVFAIKVYEKHYVLGKVLLNIQEDCNEFGSPNQLLKHYCILSNTFIVKIYQPIFTNLELIEEPDALFPHLLVDDIGVKTNKWSKIGNLKVLPEEIDFPELITGDEDGRLTYRRGEISILLSGNKKHWDDKISSHDPFFGPFLVANPMNGVSIKYNILYQAGKIDLIREIRGENNVKKFKSIKKHLDGLPELRKEVFENIGEDPNMPYYELALKHGHDISRFLK